MREEHDKYMLFTCLNGLAETRTNLSHWIEREIEKPERGKGFGVHLPEEEE